MESIVETKPVKQIGTTHPLGNRATRRRMAAENVREAKDRPSEVSTRIIDGKKKLGWYHPTKGWRTIGYFRARAANATAEIQEGRGGFKRKGERVIYSFDMVKALLNA